jgi:EAL domain-containing protein (putative c-di-GMP-specific phosphodiesterase class I)
VLPDEFIPLAEQTGMMQPLTDLVIEIALIQSAQWWRAGLHVPVAVNVSVRDLFDERFAERLAAGLARHDLPAAALMLEITERVLMAHPERAATTLAALSRLGVHLSLDDFGTGYSSLVLLKRLPVSEIKVDRSFVNRLVVDEDDAAIVGSIVNLAHALGLHVVAEGVEDDDTLQRLHLLGCEYAQGWHIGGPMSAAALTGWLEERAVITQPTLWAV